MADTKFDVIIEIKDKFSSILDKIKSGIKTVGDEFDNVTAKVQKNQTTFLKASAGFAAIGAAGVLAMRDWVGEAETSNVALNQLNSVLKSTKNAAGLTSEELVKMASSLQSVTSVGDDAIITAQTMLLSFTSIHKDVFPKVTETLLDMATAMNNGVTPSAEQLSSQAIQLGKALNDPMQGMAALSRVGVAFTDVQKKQIETMQKAGNIAGAQKVILAELATEFGGRAKDAANTFTGKMEQMNNRMGDVKENLGNALLPILEKFTGLLDKVLKKFESLSPEQQKIIAYIVAGVTAFALITATLLTFIVALASATTALAVFGITWTFLLATVLPIIGLLILIGIAIYQLIKHWDEIKAKVIEVWDKIKDKISEVTEAITTWVMDKWNGLKDGVLNIFSTIWQGIVDYFTRIKDTILFIGALIVGLIMAAFDAMGIDIVAVFTNMYNYIVTIWTTIKDWLVATFESIKTTISDWLTTLKARFLEGWTKISSTVKDKWEEIKKSVVDGLAAVKDWITNSTKPISDAFSGIWDSVKNKTQQAMDGLKEIVKSSINWLIEKINSFIKAANQVAQKGAGALGVSIPTISEIPMLAKGGIVNSPTLAMIGEAGPEAVVPLGKNGGGFGGNITVNITGTFLSEEAAMSMADAVVQQLKLSNAVV